MTFLKKHKFWFLPIFALLVTSGLIWQATRWVYDDALEELGKTGGERLSLYDGTLHVALDRYAHLPYVLSQNSDVQRLLESGEGAGEVNRYLERLNGEAGSEAFFVMNAAGDTLASSNWREPLTYVGQNYLFRPYFIAAQAGKKGHFFAIGATTGRPGYFLSHPVEEDGRFLGAAMVKVDLTPLQTDWRDGGETVLVSDASGVAFLSSRGDWRYRSLAPLTAAQRELIRAGKQYGDKTLERLPMKTVRALETDQRIVEIAGARHLMRSRDLTGLGWQLHHLLPLAPAREQARLVAIIGTILALLLLALGMYARERNQKRISGRKVREAEALREMNLRLQEEIAEHNRTESALRETQNELVQAGKLAALGHMAAGIVHELNQPIAAIRTFTASCKLLLERRENGKLAESLLAITRTTEHMATITAQLKAFAYKSPQAKEPVIVQESLEGVLTMTAPLLREHEIELKTEAPEAPLVVSCNRGRIKQVLVNLIRNAVDAMGDCERRELRITVARRGAEVEISVSDSGVGIAEKMMGDLFTPFVTTKDVGEGLGLGLSISYRIVTDLGGTIRAQNLPHGGACFVVRLPLTEEQQEGKDD